MHEKLYGKDKENGSCWAVDGEERIGKVVHHGKREIDQNLIYSPQLNTDDVLWFELQFDDDEASIKGKHHHQDVKRIEMGHREESALYEQSQTLEIPVIECRIETLSQ